jgi:hypothetical protein
MASLIAKKKGNQLYLSLDKMLSGVNALEINDIQEGRTGARLAGRSGCNNVTWR